WQSITARAFLQRASRRGIGPLLFGTWGTIREHSRARPQTAKHNERSDTLHLVALPPVLDLSLRAKDLFVAATLVITLRGRPGVFRPRGKASGLSALLSKTSFGAVRSP